jgi:transcriptional regulator CtsR
MGECTSRPVQEDINKHITEVNKKNDQYFSYEILQGLTNEMIISCNKSSLLHSKLKLLQEKVSDLNAKVENYSLDALPELRVEVQKAVNLFSQPYCLNKGKPFVEVTLGHDGPKQKTFESTMFTPFWYKFFVFKELFHFSFITFKVLCKKSFHQKTLGSLKIMISDLENQKVLENWFELEESDSKGMIRIRIQHIHNEKAFLNHLIQDAEEKIKSLKIMIQVLETI